MDKVVDPINFIRDFGRHVSSFLDYDPFASFRVQCLIALILCLFPYMRLTL